ncbi:MAG: hypothetical protein EA416_05620, partial [Trueperaceae bacterium]
FHHASVGSVAIAAVLHGSLNASTEVSARFAATDAAWLVGPYGVVVALLVFVGWTTARAGSRAVARSRTPRGRKR